jgi:hypothetical protein
MDWARVLPEGRVQGIATEVAPQPHVMKHLQRCGKEVWMRQRIDDWNLLSSAGCEQASAHRHSQEEQSQIQCQKVVAS